MGRSMFFSLLVRQNLKGNTFLGKKSNGSKQSFQFITSSFPSSSFILNNHHCQQFRAYQTEVEKNVKMAFRSGLPIISVPLPSRHELCNFTLRPVSSTVGDFLTSLKLEDKGIDRAHIYATDGCRVASTTPIEYLLKDKFVLTVNEESFEVDPPAIEHTSSEQVPSVDSVKVLISQLYSQLHIDQHQLEKERELMTRLEQLKEERKPLDERKSKIAENAAKRTRILMWAGLAGMATQFGILARLTWWEYSWDIMEPVTYFVTYGTALAMYGYFVLTQQEYIYPDARDRQYLRFFHKQATKSNFNIEKYNKLCDDIAQAEQDLHRLRDPLQLQLPIDPIRLEKMEGVDKA